MKLKDIFTFENVYDAYKNCRKGKQHKGEVIRFEANLSVNIYKIIKEITTKKYKLGNYKKFSIYEPKERVIEALSFKDRVVVRCFCDVSLKPKIEKKLIYDNAACRKGKGTYFAIERLHHFLRSEYQIKNSNTIYFLKCDIKKYFPSIQHNILLNLLEKVDFSKEEMWMIQKLIKEQPNQANKGLPLGNQSSQWFALFYLNKVDRFIKEKLRVEHYIRYMDDMILLSNDKDFLKQCKEEIQVLCEQELGLELNSKTQIGLVKNGIDFLGYRHLMNEKGKIMLKLRQSSKLRMKKHIRTMNKLYNKQIVDEKYVFTDGFPAPGNMPKEDLKNENIIWIVYGNKDFHPCCGKVFQITESQLKQMSASLENPNCGKSR